MKDLTKNSLVVVLSAIALSLSISVSAETYSSIIQLLSKKQINCSSHQNIKNKLANIGNSLFDDQKVFPEKIKKNIIHKKMKRWLHGKPSMVNIILIDPKETGAIVKPSFGSYFLNSIKRVKDIVHSESAIVGINASYFKQDIAAPLGVSVIDNKIVTGPLYKRVTFGITHDKEFKMGKVDISGDITIGNKSHLSLFNINQSMLSKYTYTIFTDKWGPYTPKTSSFYSHIVVLDNKICYIKNSRVHIPRNGFVIVGPHKYLPKGIHKDDIANYTAKLSPNDWNNVEYAVGGGPYLIKEGKIFIDKQRFSKSFLWKKAPRTAIGYTKSGTLILVTIDGRQEKFSEGATLPELAHILWELGAYNAMNFDGGTSTQMVVDGKIVNNPTVKGGSRVTNALVIIAPTLSVNN